MATTRKRGYTPKPPQSLRPTYVVQMLISAVQDEEMSKFYNDLKVAETLHATAATIIQGITPPYYQTNLRTRHDKTRVHGLVRPNEEETESGECSHCEETSRPTRKMESKETRVER